MNFVFYVVNSGKLFVMESDPVTTATPLLNGAVVRSKFLREVSPTLAERQPGDFPHRAFRLRHCIRRAQSGRRLLTTNGSGALSLTSTRTSVRAPNSVTGARERTA